MTPLPRPQPVAGAPLQPGLPTMYDLPSEFPEESGLPDVFHDLQPPLPSASPPGKLEVYERYLQVPHYIVCGLGVLPVKPLHLRQGKVVQGEGLHLDVEGAGTMEAIATPRRHLVVPHIPHADQGNALGKPLGPQGIARSQLPEQGDQGLIPQGIHLVDKYHQGTGAGLRP